MCFKYSVTTCGELISPNLRHPQSFSEITAGNESAIKHMHFACIHNPSTRLIWGYFCKQDVMCAVIILFYEEYLFPRLHKLNATSQHNEQCTYCHCFKIKQNCISWWDSPPVTTDANLTFAPKYPIYQINLHPQLYPPDT